MKRNIFAKTLDTFQLLVRIHKDNTKCWDTSQLASPTGSRSGFRWVNPFGPLRTQSGFFMGFAWVLHQKTHSGSERVNPWLTHGNLVDPQIANSQIPWAEPMEIPYGFSMGHNGHGPFNLTMGLQWVCPNGSQVGFEWVNPNPCESH